MPTHFRHSLKSKLPTVLFIVCTAVSSFAFAKNQTWPIDRNFRVEVRIDTASLPVANRIPVSVEIDFAKLLSQANETHEFAPRSIIVTAVDLQSGEQTVIEHLADENFHKGPAGSVSWIITNQKQNQYYIYFDTAAHGPYPPQNYIPTIGVGDNFRYNRNDLITESFFYRNTGKLNPAGMIEFERESELAELESRDDMRILSFTDHDGDGVKDLFYFLLGVHYSYESPPPVNYYFISLYRRINTSPPGQKPNFLNTLEPIYIDGKLQLDNRYISDFWDIDGDGDLDLVGTYLPLDRIPAYPKNCYWLNTAPKGQPPTYGPAENFPNYTDYIISNTGQAIPPLVPSPAADRFDFLPVNNASYQGLFAEEHDSIRYLQTAEKRPAGSIPAWTFNDRGLLCQNNARCAVGTFSGVDVADWENDGDWDFIIGDEAGFIWLIENIGSNQRPVFNNPLLLQADHEPMRVERWYYLQDGNPEYFLGQTKSQYLDWDNDGDFDIIAANNTDRIVWFENTGSRTQPQFASPVTLRVGLDEAPWVFRCRPAIADFDGDGLPDIVTLSKHAYLCLFRRDPDAGLRQMLPGEPLNYTDGKVIRNWNMTVPGAPLALASLKSDYKTAPRSLVQFEAADWDADGDIDIISTLDESYDKKPAFWENITEGPHPLFKHPVELKCWDKQIMLGRHEQIYSAVDWFGSGKLDLVCGAESGWFFYFHRSTLDNPAPPKIIVADHPEIRP